MKRSHLEWRIDALVSWLEKQDYNSILKAKDDALSGVVGAEDVLVSNFALLLVANRRKAHSVSALSVDRILNAIDGNLTELRKKVSSKAYTRFLCDASEALTRVGRYKDARNLLDPELKHLGLANRMRALRARAAMCWIHDPHQAISDLGEVIQSGKAREVDNLFLSFLSSRRDGKPSLVGHHVEFKLIEANAFAKDGEKAAYWKSLNDYFSCHGLSGVASDGPEIFNYHCLSPVEAAMPASSHDGVLVSVVMTTFNSESTLQYAVNSILGQTHSNLELLVVDDGSTDETRAMLDQYRSRDSRIKILLNEKNLGTYAAKNRAIEVAEGAYITFHDSDDWAHPERLAVHVQLMEANPSLKASRSDWLRTYPDGEILFPRWNGKFQHTNPASTFIRRELVEEIGYFDNVRFGADTELWFRLVNRFGKERLKSIEKCLGFGLVRADSLTRGGGGALSEESFSLPRSEYSFSQTLWHHITPREALYMPISLERRLFWAPEEMTRGLPQNENHQPILPIRSSDDLLQRTVPGFFFGISLASAEVTKDWKRTQELLSATLKSVLGQTDGRFQVLICGHEYPDIPEMKDLRITFLKCDVPPPKNSSGFRKDKMRKRRLIGAALRELGGGYFFPLDADDLVHKNVVQFALQDNNKRGYLLDKGYALDRNNRKLADVETVWDCGFNYVCGSSGAIYFEKDDLPKRGDHDDSALYFNLFQSHAYWPNTAREFGRPLTRLPFAAGVYVVNHSQNLSFGLQRAGIRSENIVAAINTHKLADIDRILAEDFSQ